jgi:hypothetical protein
MVYDAVLAGFLLAGVVLYSLYMAASAAQFNVRASYNAYDGSVLSRARWLLPARASYGSVVATPVAQQALNDQLQQLNFSAPVAPGYPGRWLLPVDDSELDEYATALHKT